MLSMTTTIAAIKSETALMIYADQKVANMMRGKLAKRHPGKVWEIAKVLTGYQVREVPPVQEAPKPVKKPVIKVGTPTVTVTLPFKKETVRWIDFAGPVGPKGITYFHKAHVVSKSIEGDMITLEVNRKKAIEKGLIEKDAA
jgi:hypothetical protein